MRLQGLLLALVLVASTASANTYTVTSTADSGAGSLRQAILDANANPGADTIAFAIVGTGPHTIAPTSALPIVTGSVTIDGYTQSGSSANTNPTSQGLNTVLKIEIDGTSAGATSCVRVQADDVTIKGLVINRCTGDEIEASGVHANLVVEGCFLGTNADGTQGLNPFATAIRVGFGGSNPRIGGTLPAARNLVCGGSNAGVQIQLGDGSPEVTNGLVAGNLIGTDITGTLDLTNDSGKGITMLSDNVVVGGTSAAARNVINGGIVVGAGLGFASSSGNLIQGNYIGVDVTGTGMFHCRNSCIEVKDKDNTIGGSAAGAGNRIGGSDRSGIFVPSTGDGAIILGNYIGTDETGNVALPNEFLGVEVQGATGVVIGGTNPGEGNLIAYTTFYGGVGVGGSGTATIRGNSIFENTSVGLGIDLFASSPNGLNYNDAGDADTGGNGYQNYPIISSVTYGPTTTTVDGTLSSASSTTFDLDFYANPICSRRPQDLPEGKTYLGTLQSTTDGSGAATFHAVLSMAVPAGSPITATATDPGGNTSEFTPRFVVSTTPQSGPPTGGNTTVKGLDFVAGATVTVGGLPATNVNVTDVHTLTMTTPNLPAGSINAVTVQNPGGGLSGTLPNGWIADFLDVPGNNQFYLYVTRLVAGGITAGIGNGLYGVNQGTLRQQMAVFLLKSKLGVCYTPPPCSGTFPDVPCSSNFAPWIEALAAQGITGGCGGGNYCPANVVTRQQMAVFLLKAKHGSQYVPPPCEGHFADVPCPSQFADWIEQLQAEGVTGGCGGQNYCPLNNVTRGQMAAFLVNTFTLP